VATGINTDVEYDESVYHVQTESLACPEPTIRTMVFAGGQVLVRMSVSHADVATRVGFTASDVRHVVELQHWNLVRKIKHGMLADSAATRSTAAGPRRVPAAQDPPAEPKEAANPGTDASVRELLAELERVVNDHNRRSGPRRSPRALPVPEAPHWRRLARRFAIVLRW